MVNPTTRNGIGGGMMHNNINGILPSSPIQIDKSSSSPLPSIPKVEVKSTQQEATTTTNQLKSFFQSFKSSLKSNLNSSQDSLFSKWNGNAILVLTSNRFFLKQSLSTFDSLVQKNSKAQIFSQSSNPVAYLIKDVDSSSPISEDGTLIVKRFKSSEEDMNSLRDFMGSVHQTSSTSKVVFVSDDANQDTKDEIDLWKNAQFASLKDFDSFSSLKEKANLESESLSEIDFLRERPKGGELLKCWLEMNYEAPKFFKVEPNVTHPTMCFAIPTYSKKARGGFLETAEELSLYNVVLESLIRTHKDSKLKFSVYLATQVDPFFDNPDKLQSLKDKWHQKTKENGMDVPLHIYRWPLSHGLVDITWKWNQIIKKAYEGGCEYIYQYSDDTTFLINNELDTLVDLFKKQSNFGDGGMFDNNNPTLLTLSMSHRNHIDALGSYWPTQMKNWWSDNWAHQIYGEYAVTRPDLVMKNEQSQGQRYDVCSHTEKYLTAVSVEATNKIIKWLEENPTPEVDINYFKERDVNYFKELWRQRKRR
eukprot:TRINITY_DN736_c0_g2_i1.p1 TRINITY_DN736_c0_g2~~TRINITY_DN736_c0_g2_i1.p1  ORF type:complete len:534 (+),score=217.11 TRINITY_DN736_c0_g2_i1:539-2140(+)